MKKWLKISLFAVILTVLFVIMTFGAAALDDVQGSNPYMITKSDGTTAYAASMTEAVTYAKDGSTIYLVASASSEATSAVTITKTLTLEGNGYSITTDSKWVNVQPGGDFTLQNCNFVVGKHSVTEGSWTITIGGSGDAQLTIKGTNTFIFDANGSAASSVSKNYLIFANNSDATVNVESGTTIYQIGHGYGIYANAVKALRAQGLTVTNVMDATTYSTYSGALCLRDGEAVLSGCTIMQNATTGAALICENGASMHLINCNVTGARAISNANTTGALGGEVYIYSGTYEGKAEGAVTVRRETTGAEFHIYGGTFIAPTHIINFEISGGVLNIHGGTFTSTDWVVNMQEGTSLNIDQSSTQFEGVTYGESTLISVSGSGGVAKLTAPSTSVTINGGTITATENATLFSMSDGTFNVRSGELVTEDTATAFAMTAGTLTLNDGLFRAKDDSVTVDITGGNLTINGGTFNTNKTANTLYVSGGNTLITDGQFASHSGKYIMDIVLVEGEGSFEIRGGTFTLKSSNSAKGSAIIRTGVRVTPQHNVNQYYDPTDIYFLSSADILLSGGVFIDDRSANNLMIDAKLGTSRVVISGAVLLSQYRKTYFVDANDSTGGDILLSADAPVCKYGENTYYFYTATPEGDGDIAPVMQEGAGVALTASYEGIRFTSYIPADVVSALSNSTYTFGTLIAPADYVVKAGGFTHALLDALHDELSTSENSVTTYVDIGAVNSDLTNPDGSISFSGTLVNLREENYTRSFAAVSYILVNGTYYYSEYDVADHVRSMAVIAKREYTAVVDMIDADHPNPSLYKEGAHSAYTDAEQERLLAYSGYTHTWTCATFTPSTAITVGEDGSANLKAAVTALTAKLEGLDYSAGTGYPILVGNTGAEETVQALSEIEGHGYYIGVINEKLVIVGTTNLLTMQALSVFESVHLAAREEDGRIILWEDIASDKEMVSLGTDAAFVFSRKRDGNIFSPYVTEAEIDSAKSHTNDKIYFNAERNHLYNYEINPDFVDYPLVAALEIGKEIIGNGYSYCFVPDDLDDGAHGIYVGVTDKAHTLLNGNDIGYYGYAIEGGNVIISSFDDATLRLAKKMFLDDLADFAVGNGYMIPTDYSFKKGKADGFTGAFNNYSDDATIQAGANVLANELSLLVTDFPRPAGLQLTSAVTVGNNSLELLFENATLTNYQEYCALLQTNGYEVYMNNRYIRGNAFVTYYNSTNNVTLHVMYSAYPYAESETIETGPTLAELFVPTLRVVAARVDGTQVRLLPQEFLSIPQYEKVTDSKLTVVQLHNDHFGYCYVYTLEDGRFVVLDGGDSNAASAANLYDVLVELYKETHNQEEPTEDEPIEIAAWYLSHTHSDHWGMVSKFIGTYCDGTYPIVTDCIIGNFVSNDQAYNCQNPNLQVYGRLGTDKWLTSNGQPIPYYRVHTGQRFFISNLEFEVMYTAEDLYPWATLFFNNSSVVMRLTSHNTNGTGTILPGSTSTSTMVLADAQVRASMVMRATWGSYAKSDMVASAHHLLKGVESELYELIDAQVILATKGAGSINSVFFNRPTEPYIPTENQKLLRNTHWLYMIFGNISGATSSDYYNYNVTVKLGFDGVAGLYEGGDDAFLNGLYIVAGDGSLSFGTGQYDVGTYVGNGLLVNRSNFDIPMPPYDEVADPVDPIVEDDFDSEILDIGTILGIAS